MPATTQSRRRGQRRDADKYPIASKGVYWAARTERIISRAAHFITPQWLKTSFLVLLWIAFAPLYIQIVSPYATLRAAEPMALGLAVSAGMIPHLWPSRTPPYRTVLWAFFASSVTGMIMLTLGAGRFALLASTLVGFGVVFARAGENGRKVWGLFQEWRLAR